MEDFSDIEDTEPFADPDGDGIANLLEYILDGHPGVPNTAKLPVAEITAHDDMLFVFSRLRAMLNEER
jgi:hypothetical protein